MMDILGIIRDITGKLFNSPMRPDPAYAVSEEQRPFVATGAILVKANQWTPQSLIIAPTSKIQPREVLCGFWDVNTSEEALQAVDSFLTDGDSRTLDPMLEEYLSGNKTVFTPEQQAMLEFVEGSIMVGYKWNGVVLKRGDIDAVRTSIAWDIERAAFIARLAFNCELMDEPTTWEILKTTRHLAELNFQSWCEYLISFIKGRALVMTDESYRSGMDAMFSNGLLLNDLNWGDVWKWSPLGG
ncbi:MAG: DUF1266 domain-containing protein [Deferribacteraceae bacterium]|jgi:hypothetical protein|nr:DUF1266 domain-containing protein [Deferribacteraceae bacterium]